MKDMGKFRNIIDNHFASNNRFSCQFIVIPETIIVDNKNARIGSRIDTVASPVEIYFEYEEEHAKHFNVIFYDVFANILSKEGIDLFSMVIETDSVKDNE